MEGSASAPVLPSTEKPVLNNEDYRVPSDGIGDTGLAKRVIYGAMSKDKGTYSSRINQIVRQAEKVPGPGKYIGHTQWVSPDKVAGTRNIYETVTRFGAKFENSSREFKPLSKVPAPSHYERKDVATGRPNDCTEVQSCRLRTKLGKASKGPKRNFLDSVIDASKQTPSPGQYHSGGPQILRNKLEVHHGAPNMEIKKAESRKAAAKPEIAPNHYNPQYPHEEKLPNWTVPKAQGNNFVDKAVRSKMLDKKTPFPSPGQHNLIGLNTVSRGTKQLSVGGLGRGACSGYF